MNEPHPLIEALKKAASDPEARPAFYELLLKSTVFVPGLEETAPEGAPPQIRLKQWTQPEGFMATPFFADPADLKAVLNENEPHLALPALELFRLTRGATLVLSTVGHGAKAFKPDEVEALLASKWALEVLDPLAAALERATAENSAAAKADFYNTLFNSQVFVFGHPRPRDGEAGPLQEPGRRALSPEDQFAIATVAHPGLEGQRIIPFFSSNELLHRAARGANLPDQTAYMGFGALTLLRLAKGMGLPLALNLGPTTYKIFTLEEIDHLLDNVRQDVFEQRRFKPGEKVYVGPPEVYPQELVSALIDFLPGRPEVKAAYLTTLREGGPEAEAVLVIGFETEEGADLAEMLNQTSPVAASHAPPGLTIDFARVIPGEKGLSQLLLEKTDPFYRKSSQKAPAAPPAEAAASARIQYETPGFFGRLKRVFKG